MNRRCIEVGCIRVTARTRCPQHERAHRSAYGGTYQKERLSVLGGPCTLALPGCTGIATTADHVIPKVAGGSHGPLRGACAHCNSSRGDGTRSGVPGGRGAREDFERTRQDPCTVSHTYNGVGRWR